MLKKTKEIGQFEIFQKFQSRVLLLTRKRLVCGARKWNAQSAKNPSEKPVGSFG
jgi:hypothetical protein